VDLSGYPLTKLTKLHTELRRLTSYQNRTIFVLVGTVFEILTEAVLQVIPHVIVFALAAPEQKQLVLTTFKTVERVDTDVWRWNQSSSCAETELSESPKKPGQNAAGQEEASSSARDAMKEMDSAETLVLLQEQRGKDTS